MYDQPGSFPYQDRRRIEAAVLVLMLTEDLPWRADELAERLSAPTGLIALATATLRADGLLISDGEKLRASWTAVRGDEIANWHDSNERRACMQPQGAAIPLY